MGEVREKPSTTKAATYCQLPRNSAYVVEGRKGPPQAKRANEYPVFRRRVLRENWPLHADVVVVP
jgi:hypothetical protein